MFFANFFIDNDETFKRIDEEIKVRTKKCKKASKNI
jgi:hypothetical protein